MKKDKQKKIPFATLRKGIVSGLLGVTMLAAPFALTGCGKDGATGPQGPQGPAGAAAPAWHYGTVDVVEGALSGAVDFTAVNGDFYIDTDSYKLYKLEGTSWTLVMDNFGAPGTSNYTHVKYSVEYPDSNDDIGDEISNWIGIYNGPSATAPVDYTQYQWAKISDSANLATGVCYRYNYTTVPSASHVFPNTDGKRLTTLVPIVCDEETTITIRDAENYEMAAWEANDEKTQLTQAWGSTITLPANRAFYVVVRNKTAPNDNVNIEGKQMNLTEFVNGLPEANQTVSADKDAWKNKSVCFVGDSITADNSAGAWYKQLAAKLGVTNYTTAAVGGSCASVTNDQGTGRDLLVNRWNSIPQKDVYVIMIGTNDWGHDTPIGSVYDTTDVSFCGALNVIVNGLKTKYPASEIVFVTPMDRIVYKSETRDPGAENNAGDTLADFAMAIQAIGAKHGCMVVDAYTYSGVDPTNTAQFADGLHPTAEGSRVMVENTWEQFLLLSKFYF